MRTSILLAATLVACQTEPADQPETTDTELARCAADGAFGLLWQVDNQHGEILAMEVISSGVVALTSEDRSVKRWMIGQDATGTPTDDGNPVYGISFPDAGAPVLALSIDEADGMLFGGDDDGNLLMWDLSDLDLADSVAGDNAVRSVAVDPGSGDAAWATWEFGGGVRTWDRARNPTEPLASQLWGVSEVVYLPGGDLFVVGDWYGVTAWERWTPGASEASAYWQSPDITDAFAYSVDLTTTGAAVVGGEAFVAVVDPDAAAEGPTTWVDLEGRAIDRVAASPTQDLFATVERAGTLTLWDGEAQALAGVEVADPIEVGWGPSGERVLVATANGMLQAWGCTE